MKRRLVAISTLAAVLALGPATGADPSDPTPPPPPPPAANEARGSRRGPETMPAPELWRLASDSLVSTALSVLRGITEPTEEDYRLTALALRLAQRQRSAAGAGADVELLRLERDAWQSAGDDDEALELTRSIVRADPDDQVSLLRALTARVRALQDVDQRLAAYDRLLGPEGKALDPSIRSRLALDAALIARENGDEARFLDRLAQAATLDVTNKDAAVLYATVLLDGATDPRQRADLLGNIVLADPTDAEAFANLAMECFEQGAYAAASRFLDDATRIIVSAGNNLKPEEIIVRYLATWLSEGPEALTKQLDEMLTHQRTVIYNFQRERERQGLDPAPESEPRLPAQYETLRLALAFAAGDAEELKRSVESLAATAAEQIKAFEEREGAYLDLTEAEARTLTRRVRTELIFDRVWAGVEIDEAERDLEALAAEEPGEGDNAEDGRLDAAAVARFRAMIAVRRGAVDSGLAALESMGATDIPAMLGRALALEASGRSSEAIGVYARLAHGEPATVIGAACRGRIESLLGRPLAPAPAAAALEEWASRFAPWIDAMTEGPRRYMTLAAAHTTPMIDIFDRIEVRLTLKNTSKWPLALGPDSAINSRFLLTPRVTVKGVESREMALPEVTNLDRKLRLGPGEQVSVVVWASRGPVGTLASLTATKATKIRWRVMQGYRMDRGKGIVPGQLSISTETDLLSVYTLAERTEAEVVEGIRTGEGRAFLEAVTVAGGMGAARKAGESKESNLERRRAFADALAERLPSLNEYERVWALATAIPGGMFHAGPALLDAARTDESPMVKALLLAGPYRGLEPSEIPDLSGDADPEVAAMAKTLAARSKRMAPTP